jgi:hypothetical protein
LIAISTAMRDEEAHAKGYQQMVCHGLAQQGPTLYPLRLEGWQAMNLNLDKNVLKKILI